MRTHSPLAVLLTLFAAAASADDWPQWRGPNRDGKSAETGLLKTWPQGGPPLAWTADNAGIGYGSPSVADGKVFVMGNGRGEEWAVCLEEKTGKTLWACASGRIRSNGGGYPGPRCTPSFANGKVYFIGLAGRIVCCDANKGTPIWYRQMVAEFGGKEPTWGYSESPLVDGDRVICTPGMQNTVVALDAKTGKSVWEAKAGDPASYSSVIKAVYENTPQYVAFTERGLIGIRATDGTVLWRYDMPSNGQANCCTPVAVGKTVFAASGFGRGGGCAWIRTDDTGAFAPKELYSTNKTQCQHGGYVVVNRHLYGCGDPGVLVCLDYTTGKPSAARRTGRFSIAYADGMLYMRHETGKMELWEASPTKPVSRGSFEQPYRSKFKAWAHPVIANGRLYLRDQTQLLCYNIQLEEKKEPAGKGPVAKEPASKEPAGKEPADKEPKAKEPAGNEVPTKEPPGEGPAPTESTGKEPAVRQPTSKGPDNKGPAAKEPAGKEPAAKEPVAKGPVTAASKSVAPAP